MTLPLSVPDLALTLSRDVYLTWGPRKLTLTPSAPVAWNQGSTQGYRFRLAAVGDGMDSEVFVHLRTPKFGTTPSYTDEFSHLASPDDLSTLPAGSPDLDDEAPEGIGRFFRLSEMDVVVPNLDYVSEMLSAVVADAQELVRSLDLFEDLEELEPIVIGG